MSARTSDGSLAPDLGDTDPNLHDDRMTLAEMQWRELYDAKPTPPLLPAVPIEEAADEP